MTEKLIKLIESELPEFFQEMDLNYFKLCDFKTKEMLIEVFLKIYYPHENQIEQRNKFRIRWNKILRENDVNDEYMSKLRNND